MNDFENKIAGEVYTPCFMMVLEWVVVIGLYAYFFYKIDLSRELPELVSYAVILLGTAVVFIRGIYVSMIRISYDGTSIQYFRPNKMPVRFLWKDVVGVSAGFFAFRVRLTHGRSFYLPNRVNGDKFLSHAKLVVWSRPVEHLQREAGSVGNLVGYNWIYILLTVLVPALMATVMDYSDDLLVFYFVLLTITSLSMNFIWFSAAREVVVHDDRVEWRTVAGKRETVFFRSVSHVDRTMIWPPSLMNPIRLHLKGRKKKEILIANSAAGKELFDMLRFHINRKK